MNKVPINNNKMFYNFQNIKGFNNNVELQNKPFKKNNQEEVKLDVILNNIKIEGSKDENQKSKNIDSHLTSPNEQIIDKNFEILLKENNSIESKNINHLIKDEFNENKNYEKFSKNFKNIDINISPKHLNNNYNTISKLFLIINSIRN